MKKSTNNINPKIVIELSTTNVPTVLDTDQAHDIRLKLEQNINSFETITYIYVVDRDNKFQGYFTLKQLYSAPISTPASKIVSAKVSVKSTTPPHQAALKTIHEGISSIAVIDEDNNFKGALTSLVIIKILDSHHLEHSLRRGGISRKHKESVLSMSVLTSLKHRLPWLILGLLGGIITAGLVRSFENTLEKNLILAAFIPLVSYMADAVGTQMEAFIIRDLAVDPGLNFKKYFFKQFKVVFLISIIVSLLLYFSSYILYKDQAVSLIVSIGLLIAVISSLFTGMTVPYFFSKLKYDPADASGPVATIAQNVLSLLIYFGTATIIL